MQHEGSTLAEPMANAVANLPNTAEWEWHNTIWIRRRWELLKDLDEFEKIISTIRNSTDYVEKQIEPEIGSCENKQRKISP